MSNRIEKLHTRMRVAERRVLKAIESADRRGYTGYMNSRGGLSDDPLWIKAMRRYNKTMLDYQKARVKARRKTKTRGSR